MYWNESIAAVIMRDTVKHNDPTTRTAVHGLEATDSRMQQSIGVDADIIVAPQHRCLRNWFFVANAIAWIAIIALIRWLLF